MSICLKIKQVVMPVTPFVGSGVWATPTVFGFTQGKDRITHPYLWPLFDSHFGN